MDGVWSVDLARLADPALVLGAVAAAVHVNLNPEDPLASLVAALSNSSMLLVLDNCAHVIDAVASLVVAITKGARGVHILATSREPLRVEGEHICRLEPLETPPSSERLDAAEALRFPAVQLFVDRMAASHEEFELRDEDASLVAEICRQLDGIPLAIELAAARVDLLGVRELAARLEEGLQVLKGGRRTVLPRHRTMRATLDWSYGLLSPPEQTVFSRLAIFAGGFTLAAAAAVVGDADLGGEEVVDLVLELATKSLVAADGNFLEPRFRLLATTRAYALEKARNVPNSTRSRSVTPRISLRSSTPPPRRCRVRQSVRRPCTRDQQPARRARMGVRATGRSGGRHRLGSRLRAALGLHVDAG